MGLKELEVYHTINFMILCTICNQKVSFLSFYFHLNLSVLELEFNEFARGKWEITELEFAEMLLRFTDTWDMEEQLREVKNRLQNQKGSNSS